MPTTQTPAGEISVDESRDGAHRRSIYLQQRRTQVTSLLEVFDAPSVVSNCTRRLPTTIPLQSLTLLNSSFAIARAAAFARRLVNHCSNSLAGHDDCPSCVNQAFLLAFGRAPDDRERIAALRFLAAQSTRYSSHDVQARRARTWADFCQVLLASNDFLYVD